MNNDWKASLDRYLTTEPEDDFTPYVEAICNYVPEEFYNQHESWFDEYDGECNRLLSLCFSEGIEPKQAARFIETIYQIFKP